MNIKEFNLPATIIGKLKLDDLLGKWSVLYFYPRDNTPGCTVQACEFGKLYQEFQGLGCQIIGANDNKISDHEKFSEKYNIPYPLITDEEREFLKALDVYKPKKFLGKEYLGVVRTTLIINPEGKIVKRYDKVRSKGHAEKVLNDLKELQKSN